MMYSRLLRIFFKENFSINRFFGTDIRKNKKKAVLLGVLILYGFGSFLFSFGYMFFDLGKTLSEYDMLDTLLAFVFVYATVLSIMITLFRANGYLFRFKDYEILAPLPIKPRTVLFAKLTLMLALVYAGLFLISLPIVFSYFWYAGFNILTFLIFIASFLLIPMIPLIIFSFLSLLIARFSSKIRGTNIVYTILMFILLIGAMIWSFSFSFNSSDNPLLSQSQGGLFGLLYNYYPPMNWFIKAVHLQDPLSLAYLFLTHAFPLAGFIFLISKLVVKTNQRSLSVVTGRNKKPLKYRERPLIESLVMKEARKFINLPIYTINSGFGPIIMLLVGVLSLVFKNKIMEVMDEMAGFGFLSLDLIASLIIGFSTTMVFTSAISLSLEGKNFWIIKSLPIRPRLVMISKMIFNILLGLPSALIAIILTGIAFKFEASMMASMMIAAISLSLSISAIGSFINLHFPKFDYLNETEVVKQSIGAMFGVFAGFGVLLIDGVIVYFAMAAFGKAVSLLFASLVNLIIFACFFGLVYTSSDRLFQKMDA
ncbi:MAG: hypothetical protein GX904_01590 [Acholeplasmataceae bacterium]|nr:hypothetical protein [Acholeplasmataceae bacterium]